ncbi:hypothetical protein CGZ90_08320 [Fictibacillus aquaticus]|uniref:Uncharacterized protein n=1 Tax=Fictibacillus aquaticus TaxID=2021314 RepID=A0A235F9C3_9BACL|nr:hypothetical protein [Fictibacillus aquaticus]OYD57896.1 hypothetical protein CGZ90_08320 [Fictibacillus aquaticus]
MDYALVKEQGVTFAVVVVKSYVLKSDDVEEVRASYRPYFPGVPIILMAQDLRGVPTYHGRKDIVKFLSRIDHRRLPWKRKQA